eukprot:7001479-Alexandrium_andersonii.AAC.1
MGRRSPTPELGLGGVRREAARRLKAAPHLQGLAEVPNGGRKAGPVVEVDGLREVAPETPLHQKGGRRHDGQQC